jgi:tripartite-type tricarboxylate transporter receptor subunit TctC
VVVVNASLPVKNLGELISYAKANPGKVNFGTIPMTSFDVEYALFMESAGIRMTGIPYNGSAPATVALLRNEIQFLFGIASSVGSQIAAGAITPLAVTSTVRYAPYPNLPTIRETGVAYDATTNFGFWAPAKTTDAVVQRIDSDVSEALKNSRLAARIRELGYEPATVSGQQWAEEMRSKAGQYAGMVKRLGIVPQ